MGSAGNHGSQIGFAVGSLPTSIGLRTVMTHSYTGFVPVFEFLRLDGVIEASEGQFWDGCADTLERLAVGLLLIRWR